MTISPRPVSWGSLKGRSKPPGKKPITREVKHKVVENTVKERPVNATHGSVRRMAGEMGISHTSIQRIWHEHGLKPHLVRSFKASKDPEFATKVVDIIGLYRDPPAKALVFSVDEESQIQALDRRQPGLPMKKRRAGTMTQDYKRHGDNEAVCSPRRGQRHGHRRMFAPPSRC